MKIAYITAGAAGRYCGNCLRDSSLALAFRKLGHEALLLPTYTPIRTDVEDVSDRRVFFNGFRVYLEQKFAFFRKPRPLIDRLLGSRWLISLLTRMGPSTDASRLGALTVSMLRGEEGYQSKELDELVAWLAGEIRPDIVHLTNILLIGLSPRIQRETGAPVVCGLQAEDSFLDQLPVREREEALELIRKHSEEVDALVSVSHYYADFAERYFGIDRERIRVVQPGILLDGHETIPYREGPKLTVGYLGRISPEKGVHLLCEAFASLAHDPALREVRLKVAGYLARDQIEYASRLRRVLSESGLGDRVDFIGTVDRRRKLEFLQEIDVLAMPALYPDPKAMSLLEALASGVPVVAADHGAFPELIEGTQGGVLCEPEDAVGLAETLRRVLLDRQLREKLGTAGRRAVLERYGADRMARETLEIYESLVPAAAG